MPADANKLLLARAFDLAWEQYYAESRKRTISEDVARRELATCLVEMQRSGVREEGALAACGVLRLIGLTPGAMGG